MPSKKNKPPKTVERYYYPKKRKATSPIELSERAITRSDSADITTRPIQNEALYVSGQFVNSTDSSGTSFIFPVSSNTCFDSNFAYIANCEPAAMNFPPYGIQSPPAHNPYTMQMAGSATPPWITEIRDDLKTIKSKIEKIDTIEKLINTVNTKVDKLETKIQAIDTRVNEVEKSTQFLSSEYDETTQKLQSAKEDLRKLNEQCLSLEETMNNMKIQNQKIEDKTNDLEFRSIRENLLFHGIPETQSEDCEQKVKSLISETLGIVKEIGFDRVHRLGKRATNANANVNRPIVAKFHSYKDRELVRKTAFDKSEALKAVNQGVGVQQTKAVLQKRRDMQPVVDRERRAGKITKWAGSKLLVREQGGQFREVSS